jgi:hypothetical protein
MKLPLEEIRHLNLETTKSPRRGEFWMKRSADREETIGLTPQYMQTISTFLPTP